MRHLPTIFVLLSIALISKSHGESRLPDGGTAQAKGNGPVRAWYGKPTKRYDHGVLGDAIEAGSLVVVDSAGRKFEVVLSKDYVFEDITPRIADLDGDDENDKGKAKHGNNTHHADGRLRIRIWHADAIQGANVLDYDNQLDALAEGTANEGMAIKSGNVTVRVRQAGSGQERHAGR